MSWRKRTTEAHNYNFGAEEETTEEAQYTNKTKNTNRGKKNRTNRNSFWKEKARTSWKGSCRSNTRGTENKPKKPKQPESVIKAWELEVVNAIAKMKTTGLTDRKIYRKLVKIYNPRLAGDTDNEKINVQAKYLNVWEYNLLVNAEKRQANKEKQKKKNVKY